MGDAFAFGELALGSVNVAEQFELLQQALVFPSVDNDDRAAAALGELMPLRCLPLVVLPATAE